VNIVRVTLQALAAVLGGTQSLHTNARDEAMALPTEASALLALRTQQILAAESGVVNTVDPLAGSYVIEKLTDEIEAEAQKYLRKIETLGGTVRAIESGYVQREIQQAAYQYQNAIERGDRVVVGVNQYADEANSSSNEKPQGRTAGPALLPFRIDPEIERTQVERLAKLRARRDPARVQTTLRAVEETARTDRNLLPAILDAVKAYATVGEISDALRRVFGEYQESVVI
jgi:methylmalonyl-CoA mutase N-terminal domain/subunit